MNTINYARQLDHLLEQPEIKGKHLFLHSCCAPCSSYVLEYLRSFFSITVFYYNPNTASVSSSRSVSLEFLMQWGMPIRLRLWKETMCRNSSLRWAGDMRSVRRVASGVSAVMRCGFVKQRCRRRKQGRIILLRHWPSVRLRMRRSWMRSVLL